MIVYDLSPRIGHDRNKRALTSTTRKIINILLYLLIKHQINYNETTTTHTSTKATATIKTRYI